MRDRGFTLVELIVSLTIIVTVAALLTPVFKSAKRFAKESVSVSNLRQAYSSLQIYRSDCDGAEGAYSSTYRMGFPPDTYFRRVWLKSNPEMFKSGCGPSEEIHMNSLGMIDGTLTYATSLYEDRFKGSPNTNTMYIDHLVDHKENAVVFFDIFCNDPSDAIGSRYTTKKVLSILLSGQLIHTMRRGSPWYLELFSGPKME